MSDQGPVWTVGLYGFGAARALGLEAVGLGDYNKVWELQVLGL